MIQIRPGVFETNSSSSHSIVLMKKSSPREMIDPDWRLDKDGMITFWENELGFGRSPFELLINWYDRLRYAIANTWGDEKKLDELRELCRKHIKGFRDFKLPKFRRTGKFDTGYIDHESMGVLDNALARYHATMEDFLFDDRFVVSVDGDEYCVFEAFMKTDMFNPDAVEAIYPAIDLEDSDEDDC